MRPLQLWMRGVGGFYVLVGLFNTPPIIAARFDLQYGHLDIPVNSVPAQALVDVWFMFGLEILVIGAALLWFSRDPLRHIALVYTVLALEFIRGIVDDVYLIARGYDPVLYSIWILIHAVIIATGIVAIRRSRP